MTTAALRATPLILAHRGASTAAPENTLAAFRLALEQGADGIELDVQLSADGEVVVCHDHTVDRTTNGHGKVANLSLPQLKQLDAGAWFSERYTGERIPTLAEVLEIQDSGIIDIELKPGPISNPLPERVAGLIRRYNCSDRVIVTSFLPHYLSRLHQLLPDQAFGLLELGGLVGKVTNAIACAWLNFPYILPNKKYVTPSYVSAQARAGRKVISWTVDDPETLTAHQALSLAGVITNDPLVATRVRESG